MPRSLSATPLVRRIAELVVFLLFFRLVRVRNSNPVFPHLSGEAVQAKNPSNINLNQRSPKHGSSCMEEHSSHENRCNRVRSSTISSYHRAIEGHDIWKEKWLWWSCWLNEWYGNTWGSRPLIYHSELILGYWRLKSKISGFWTDQMICWACSLSGNEG